MRIEIYLNNLLNEIKIASISSVKLHNKNVRKNGVNLTK